MELGLRCFFRLGVCLLLLFVVFRNFRGFPGQEAEAIAIRFGYRNRGGSGYNSNYGGRVIYTNFGRNSRSQFSRDPVDKDRHYYEMKMAEWREKRRLLAKNDTNDPLNNNDLQDFDQEEESEEDTDNNSDSQEYDYDYSKEPETTTTMDPTTAEIVEGEETNMTSTTPITITTTTVDPGSSTKVNRGSRTFGLRYGRVKVETLRH